MKNFNKKKGDVLEKTVEYLYKKFNHQDIKKKYRYPAKNNPKRKREIDILISLPCEDSENKIEFAIECKNYRKRIGIEKIDEFIGKLDDIGIDCKMGIYVAVNDYTKDAKDRADKAGIKLLKLSGLNSDRLALDIIEEIKCLIFWSVELSGKFNDIPFLILPFDSEKKITNNDCMITINLSENDFEPFEQSLREARHNGQICINLFANLLHSLWLLSPNYIPLKIGDFIIKVQKKDVNSIFDTYFLLELSRSAYCLDGVLSHTEKVAVQNVQNAQNEMSHEHIKMDLKENYEFKSMNETEEQNILNNKVHIKLPKIIISSCYYPPNPNAINKIIDLTQKNLPITFEAVEGNILNAFMP